MPSNKYKRPAKRIEHLQTRMPKDPINKVIREIDKIIKERQAQYTFKSVGTDEA